MLEIAVHHDHGIAAREVDPGGDRELMSEVAGELRDLEAWIALVHLDEHQVAEVGAAVVDEDRLGVAVEAGEHRGQAALKLRQGLLLVVDRDDDGVGGGRNAHRQGTRTVTGGPIENTSPWSGSFSQFACNASRYVHVPLPGRSTQPRPG